MCWLTCSCLVKFIHRKLWPLADVTCSWGLSIILTLQNCTLNQISEATCYSSEQEFIGQICMTPDCVCMPQKESWCVHSCWIWQCCVSAVARSCVGSAIFRWYHLWWCYSAPWHPEHKGDIVIPARTLLLCFFYTPLRDHSQQAGHISVHFINTFVTLLQTLLLSLEQEIQTRVLVTHTLP